MERALVSVAVNREDDVTEYKEPAPPETSTLSQTSAAQVPTSLKGVSVSLLDRVCTVGVPQNKHCVRKWCSHLSCFGLLMFQIRAKEAQKLQAAMTRNPSHEDRLLMMSRLPELARILRNVFVGEKKAALIMEVACNRMMSSYRSAISSGQFKQNQSWMLMLHLVANTHCVAAS